MIFSIAIVLDPRYKLKFVRFYFSKIYPMTANAKSEKVVDHLQMLFREYLEPKLDRKGNPNLDVLAYWKENKGRYQELSLMDRYILNITITMVASESTFSIEGHIIGMFQSCILPLNAEANLCAKDWLCGQEDCDGSYTN
ncbi:hypothetical protein EJD97_003561, partial [Solanum chilense]